MSVYVYVYLCTHANLDPSDWPQVIRLGYKDFNPPLHYLTEFPFCFITFGFRLFCVYEYIACMYIKCITYMPNTHSLLGPKRAPYPMEGELEMVVIHHVVSEN